MAKLTDLPLEILLLVAQHLASAQDFLALCSSTHELQDAEDLRYAPSFWSRLTKDTFRVPNRPVVEADGKRWCNLYRRMLRETRLYVWGNNDAGSLGKPSPRRVVGMRGRVGRGDRYAMLSGQVNLQSNAAWPQELEIPDDIGVISDLQCGGWSTAALTASGRIFLTGSLNEGYSQNHHNLREHMPANGFPDDRFQQFSLGRKHMLALGDHGQVYLWATRRGARIEGWPISDLSSGSHISPTKVVAGWGHSSAFIPGIGIILWNPDDVSLPGDCDPYIRPLDVPITWTAPETGHHDPTSYRNAPRVSKTDSNSFGSIVNWIVLENFIVWVTDLGKLFFASIPDDLGTISSKPIELTQFTDASGLDNHETADVLDVQGSFRYFAVLKRNGEVLTSDQDFLNELWQGNGASGLPRAELGFQKIPALQHTGVIQVAFGDYHFHALHADGSISSYGRECQFCGSLGLGGTGIDAVRGIKARGFGGDGELLPQCSTTGRRVCFEHEKQDWMNHIRTGGRDKREAEARMNMTYGDDEVRAEVSEWIEQRLRKWEQVLPASDVEDDPDDDGLPAYFALSVAAAGWHSGALVLHNERKANRVADCYKQKEGQSAILDDDPVDPISLLSQATSSLVGLGRSFLGLPAAGPHPEQLPEREQRWTWEDETFPRLKLRNGDVMPGEAPVEDWECPEWKDVERVGEE